MQRVRPLIARIAPLDREAMQSAQERQDSLTKPRGSLGVLEDVSIRVAGMTGNPLPRIDRKVIFTMVGDHGVVEEGVSAYPGEVTAQMARNFVRGGAAINVLAAHVGARVVVVDVGAVGDLEDPHIVCKKVACGTRNMTRGPAMSFSEAVKSIEAGIDVVEEEYERGMDILGTGDMGIGNTTASSAIIAAVTGESVRKVTGRGTGVSDEVLEHKVETIEKALLVNNPDPKNPIDVLAKVGGFEIGGIAGVILAGAANRIPVVIDGLISGAAALIASELAPRARDYMIAAHRSREVGHTVALDWLGLNPLLDFTLCLGEGTGAALGISLVEAACRLLGGMSTFKDAGVCERSEKKGDRHDT